MCILNFEMHRFISFRIVRMGVNQILISSGGSDEKHGTILLFTMCTEFNDMVLLLNTLVHVSKTWILPTHIQLR